MSQIKLWSTTSWLSILATQGIICGAASATPITITETINLNQLLSAGGGNYTGLFDINSLLPQDGSYNAPLQLISANVAGFGYSNSNPTNSTYYTNAYNGTYYYQYYVGAQASYTYYGWSNGCYSSNGCTGYYYYSYAVNVPVDNYTQTQVNSTLDRTVDSIALQTAGGVSASGNDAAGEVSSSHTQGYGTYSYNYYNYYYGGPSYGVNQYNQVTTIDDEIYGSLSASSALSIAALTDLAADGQLAYTVSADAGQFILQQLRLTVTLDQSPTVPEPGTLSVFGFSLLLLALRARSINRPDVRN